MKQNVTRFAPSPTGYLHLGGARTALFNYLFAKHCQGKFLIRFEDTDLKRNINDSKNQLLQELNWLGIKADVTITNPDEKGPYCQSERLEIYQKMAEKLIKSKKAYYCFCTKETLATVKKAQLKIEIKAPRYNKKCLTLSTTEINKRLKNNWPKCYRIKVLPNQILTFQDLVYQKMTFNTNHIEDFVIIKTNGYPTYHFAVVVDDMLMNVSHVLRGSDHLSNTGKQIWLYQTFQQPIPLFGHLSLIQINKKQKLSKRSSLPEQYVNYYQKQGYLPQALFNYLALLGWTPDKFQELFSVKELITKFDGKNLNKSQSIFSLIKLDWINHKYIMALPWKEYWKQASPFLRLIKNKEKISETKIKIMAAIFQKEINYFAQLPELINYYFVKSLEYQLPLSLYLKENWLIVKTFAKALLAPVVWGEKTIEEMLKKIGEKLNLKGEKLLKPIRIATTGKKSGPQISKMLYLLGKKKIQNNIDRQKKWIKNIHH